MIKLKSNIFLILIAVSLFSYIFFIDSKTKSTDVIENSKLDIWNIRPLGIREIILKNKKETLLLKQKNMKWNIYEPITIQIDRAVLGKILTSSLNLKAVRFIHEDADDNILKQYGLTKPAITLILKETDRSNTLFIGDKMPVGGYFAKVKGDNRIFLLSEEYFNDINKGLKELRTKNLFDLSQDKIEIIGYKGNKSLRLEIKDKKWQIIQDKIFPADFIEVSDYVTRLNSIKYKSFVSDNNEILKKEDFGILVQSFFYKNIELEKEYIVDIYKKQAEKKEEKEELVAEQIYVVFEMKSVDKKGKKSIYTITQEDLDIILVGQNKLRSKKLFNDELKNISKIEFYKNKELIFKSEIKDKKWLLYKDDIKDSTLGNKDFDVFIETIKTTKIEEFLEIIKKDKIFKGDKYKLYLFKEKEDAPIVVELKTTKDDVIYGYKDNELFKLDNRMVSYLAKGADMIKKRQ